MNGKRSGLLVLLVVGLALVWPAQNALAQGPVEIDVRDPDDGTGALPRGGSGGGGARTAPTGSFLALANDDGQETAWTALMTLNGDGCSSTTRLTVNNSHLRGFDSPAKGVWTRMANGQVRIRSLYFSHSVSGIVEMIGRATIHARFDNRYQRGTGTVDIELFEPSQLLEPLDPNSREVPIFGSTTATIELRRIYSE